MPKEQRRAECGIDFSSQKLQSLTRLIYYARYTCWNLYACLGCQNSEENDYGNPIRACYRIIELLKLEKTSKTIESND